MSFVGIVNKCKQCKKCSKFHVNTGNCIGGTKEKCNNFISIKDEQKDREQRRIEEFERRCDLAGSDWL